MIKKRTIIAFIICALVVFTGGCALPDTEANGTFSTQDFNGNTVDQTIFTQAELTVVNIWGTYCGPCLNELPELKTFADNYADSGVQVIGICIDVYDDSSLAGAQQILADTGITYTNLLVNDSVNSWYTENVQYIPTTIVVDSEGNIISETVGGMTYADFEALVK